MRALFLSLVLTVAAATRPADACSLTGTYIAPTNVAQGYEAAAHARADRRLAEIAKLPNLTPAVREWTQRSIDARKHRP